MVFQENLDLSPWEDPILQAGNLSLREMRVLNQNQAADNDNDLQGRGFTHSADHPISKHVVDKTSAKNNNNKSDGRHPPKPFSGFSNWMR